MKTSDNFLQEENTQTLSIEELNISMHSYIRVKAKNLKEKLAKQEAQKKEKLKALSYV